MEWTAIVTLVLELGLAFVSGSIIGFQRGARGKAAGIKTHVLICVGAALYMQISHMLGKMAFDANPGQPFDPGRIAAQVVTGVGFIGAGTIIRSGKSIIGLTSAATIWMVAGLGLAAGSAMWEVWAIGTVVSIITLELGRLPLRILRRSREYRITFTANEGFVAFRQRLTTAGAELDLVGFRRMPSGEFEAHLRIKWNDRHLNGLEETAMANPSITSTIESDLGD
jgi:putative Mg2+ transporter-C (MgtC) family protein